MKVVKGKVAYQHLGPGFWGIIGEDGQAYRPVNMPNQLKYEGYAVKVEVVPVDEMSVFMWGQPVKVVSFETMTP
ncbi:MAG: hypothetical protein AAFW73_20610 [Bacteroidota bacterium]